MVSSRDAACNGGSGGGVSNGDGNVYAIANNGNADEVFSGNPDEGVSNRLLGLCYFLRKCFYQPSLELLEQKCLRKQASSRKLLRPEAFSSFKILFEFAQFIAHNKRYGLGSNKERTSSLHHNFRNLT
jgi:hypothetical protein